MSWHCPMQLAIIHNVRIPHMHWKDAQIHVIDFEGTRESGVIEYGVVTLQNGEIVDTATRLCQPSGEIRDADFRQHRIRKVDAESCLPFSNEWERFASMRQTGQLAAHNASVEHGLLKAQWAYPRESPDFLNSGQCLAEWGPWLDTCALYQCLYPDLDTHKLSALVGMFDLGERLKDLAEAHCPAKRRHVHCALYDALASALLLLRLADEEGFQNMTLGWLMAQSAPSRKEQQKRTQQDLF